MSRAKVLVGWKATLEEMAIMKECWPEEADRLLPDPARPEDLRRLAPEIDAVVGGISRDLLAQATRLKLIHTLGHGVEGLIAPGIREILLERKVIVARANPAAINIAEFVLMSMVALSRRVFKMHEALAYQGSWSDERKAGRMGGSLGGELYGSTLGILGFGTIGQEIARRANAFGMSVGALVRRPERLDKRAHGLAFTAAVPEIDPFLGRCDYVVIGLPLTPQTRDLINHQRCRAMKHGAYLINISRGPLIVEEALWEALRSGKLAGAALDVWRVEEERAPHGYPCPFPLHQYNVIMTPHYCGATRQSRERAIVKAGENLRRFLSGEPLQDVADLEEGF